MNYRPIDSIIPPDKIHLVRPTPLDSKHLTRQKQKWRFPFKDLLAVFICLIAVLISCLFFGKATPGAKIQFTANTIINLSGLLSTLFTISC